jgi:nucleoid-associated protein YgaU
VSVKRLLIALGIVLAGVAAALPFRQSPLPAQRVARPPAMPLALTLRKPDAPLELAPRIEVSPATELIQFGGNEQEKLQPAQPSLERTNFAPPPALPVSFLPSTPTTSTSDWRPQSLLTAPRPQSPPRPYRLRDGDTLEKIADRLLGDPTRAAEIFEANRKVLGQPDLLPVGEVIMLPPRPITDKTDSYPINNSLTPPHN